MSCSKLSTTEIGDPLSFRGESCYTNPQTSIYTHTYTHKDTYTYTRTKAPHTLIQTQAHSTRVHTCKYQNSNSARMHVHKSTRTQMYAQTHTLSKTQTIVHTRVHLLANTQTHEQKTYTNTKTNTHRHKIKASRFPVHILLPSFCI